jgi:hypothetical protein
MAYSWLTFAQGKNQLSARLADSGASYWVEPELSLYILEALQVWNALTFTWKTTFTFSLVAAGEVSWLSLGAMSGSPRLRTQTDTTLFTLMEYHLLEPPSGSVWSGTSQFTIADLSLALQRCRDEAIQISNCNQTQINAVSTTPGNAFITLPDDVLDVARARWLPLNLDAVTLLRGDTTTWNYYESGFLQSIPANPTQYNVASTAPLSLQVDIPPVDEGAYDLICLLAGPPLDPPATTVLNVPNDLAWVLKWGALADLLGRESEATDLHRAQFCSQAYTDGLKLLTRSPWVMQASINNVTASFVSMSEMDQYAPEWDSAGPDYATVVLGGTDFLTVVPDPNGPLSVSLTVLGNAPLPANDDDFVQVSRDAWDSVLDYAQFLAMFKQGGAEFSGAMPLMQSFIAAAKVMNSRLDKLGLYANEYNFEGGRQVRSQERFNSE